MTKVKSLKDFKTKKKLEYLINDIYQLNKLLNSTLNNLAPYKHYIPIKTIIFNILENKALLDLHFKNLKKALLEKKNKLE